MDFMDLHKLTNEKKLKSGKMLIAEPFLGDSNFSRSVILLCEHGEEGSLGFILNKPTELVLGDLLPEIAEISLPVNHGGPVQVDTLHMLHRMPDALGGNEVTDGVFWGGSFEVLQDVAHADIANGSDVKLFVGYAGWSPGQLEQEMKEGSWLLGDISQDVLFETDPLNMWKTAIHTLGNEYRYLANLPIDPQLN